MNDLYIRSIKNIWRIEDEKPSLTIQYCLTGNKVAMTFTIRAPTENWNYWLPTGIDYHAKEPQYENHPKTPCKLMEQGFCYADGTSLGAEKLWNMFVECKVNEDIIWKELEDWIKSKFE